MNDINKLLDEIGKLPDNEWMFVGGQGERLKFESPHLKALATAYREQERVLEQIANRDDAEMECARTLHYDMRGWAASALSKLKKSE